MKKTHKKKKAVIETWVVYDGDGRPIGADETAPDAIMAAKERRHRTAAWYWLKDDEGWTCKRVEPVTP